MKSTLIVVLCVLLGAAGSPRAATETACSNEKTLKSRAGQAVSVVFQNTGFVPVFLYWLDPEGHRKSYGSVAAESRMKIDTYAGHPWVVADSTGKCMTIVEADLSPGGEMIGLPAEGFRIEAILGWRIKVRADLHSSNPDLEGRALDLLRRELGAISKAISPDRLTELRRVTFWLDERVVDPTAPDSAMVFHPSRDWLRAHGLNPDMAGGIELPNIRYFLDSYSWEPWAILHELAHFYHFSVLGSSNDAIRRAYRHARDRHLYESVQRYDGTSARAYALENEQEYFAELTEAYFGRNDYFPFTRGELEEYDPVGFTTVRKLWEGR